MTIIIDDVSEPGSWERAIARGCVPNHSDADERPAMAAPVIGVIVERDRPWVHAEDIAS